MQRGNLYNIENCTFICFSIAGFLNYVQKLELTSLYYRYIQLVPLHNKIKYVYKQLQDQDVWKLYPLYNFI